MDFARRQLEKYGWSDGKGLGKHENGISEALKPKLKRSVTGIGHDPAAEFNEHWWSALYNKAAKNVEVKEKNGKTKKIKTVDSDNFTVTNSMWKINKKQGSKTNEYSEYFIKKATLQNGGSKEEHIDSESDEDTTKQDVFKMTDEELFAACEGRTAHKGARHGLRALGKLARIAEQEEMLLTQTKYAGYSHAKKIKKDNSKDVVENMSLDGNVETHCKIKKKEKRKRCNSNENNIEECAILPKPKNKRKLKSKNVASATSEINNVEPGRNTGTGGEIQDNEITSFENTKKVKKAKRKSNDQELSDENTELNISKKKKKKVKEED